MDVIIRGDPKEIAALVLAVQERQAKVVSVKVPSSLPEGYTDNLIIKDD